MIDPENSGVDRVEETLRVFAASIGNDLKNIFASVVNTLDILGRSSRLESSDRQRIQKSKLFIHRGSEIAHLLGSFLEQGHSKAPNEVYISAAVQEAVVLCETRKEKAEIFIDDAIIHSPHVVRFGPAAFRLTMILAIKNAIDYSVGTPVWIQLTTQDQFVYIYVKDQGRGFTPEEMNSLLEGRLDDRSEKVKAESLGLQCVNDLVRQFGGEVYIESGPGMGTVVSFGLPILREDTPAVPIVLPEGKPPSLIPQIKEAGFVQQELTATASSGSRGGVEEEAGKEIYITDPDEAAASALKRVILQIRGDKAKVTIFKSGEELLEHFEHIAEYPAWVFVDYFLPGLHGEEVIKRLLNHFFSIEGEERFGLVLMSGLPTASILKLKKDVPSLLILKKPLAFDVIQAQFLRKPEFFTRQWLTSNIPDPALKAAGRSKSETGRIQIPEG